MLSRVPIAFWKLFQKYAVKIGSLSDTMDTGTPCSRTISRMYYWQNLSNVKVIRIAKKCADFMSRSTITHTASCPCGVCGKWVTKSIVTCSHFHLATSCETLENSNFLKNGKIVILVKIQNFSRSRMTKRTSPLESYSKI